METGLKDPNDDMVLEVAVASGMDVVTFNERDFRASTRFGVRVWTPRAFLRKVEVR
jgi:predicted nucleic acid-binding protein